MRYFLSQRHILPPKNWKKLYDKLRPFYLPLQGLNFKKEPILIEKTCKKPPRSFSCLSTEGYLSQISPRKVMDDYDDLFLQSYDLGNHKKIYGYHQGSYFFFHPSFADIIKYGADTIHNSDVCFVTTRPCDWDGNTESSREFYNSHMDLCYGVTSFFPIVNGEILPI
jgi:hypothetical protein